MIFSALVIILISFPKMIGSSAYFEQHVTFKYGDFQKASRIYLREPSIFINSIYFQLLRMVNRIRKITLQKFNKFSLKMSFVFSTSLTFRRRLSAATRASACPTRWRRGRSGTRPPATPSPSRSSSTARSSGPRR